MIAESKVKMNVTNGHAPILLQSERIINREEKIMDNEKLKNFVQDLMYGLTDKAKSRGTENETSADLDEDKKAFLDDLKNARDEAYWKSSIL